jgi:uncharacterized membrane protein
MDLVELAALWVHTLAMVILLGYYGILGRIVVPALRASLDGPMVVTSLVAVERRARPLLLLSIGLFVLTGGYLLFVDEQYAGIGNFGSTWAALMVVKHLLVGAIVVLGVAFDRLVQWAAEAVSDDDRRVTLGWLGLAAEGITGLGAIVILLTGAAQLS